MEVYIFYNVHALSVGPHIASIGTAEQNPSQIILFLCLVSVDRLPPFFSVVVVCFVSVNSVSDFVVVVVVFVLFLFLT